MNLSLSESVFLQEFPRHFFATGRALFFWGLFAVGAMCPGVLNAQNPLSLTPGVSANVTLGQLSNLSAFNTSTGSADISYSNTDLATRSYVVRLPAGFDAANPSKKYGIVTYIDSGTPHSFPASYAAALDAHDVIWIGGHGIDNTQATNLRRGVAIMGAFRMSELYNIDPARVYVSGLSGGGRTASDLAYLRSDFFHGFIGRVGSSIPAVIPGFQTAGTSSAVGNYDADYEIMGTATFPSVVLPSYFRVALMSQYGDFRRAENLAIYRYGHLNHGNTARMVMRPGGHSDEVGPSFTEAMDFLYHPLVDVIWDRFENANPGVNAQSGNKVVAGTGFTAVSGNVTETSYSYNSSTHGVLRLSGGGAAAESKDTFTWQNVSGILLDARLRAETAAGQNQQIGVHIVPAAASGSAASQPGFHVYWCYGQPYRAEIVGADGTRKTLATWQHAATHPMSLTASVTSPQAGEGTVTEKTFWNAATAPDYAGRTQAFRGEDMRIVLNSVGFQLTFNRPAGNLTTSYAGVVTATTDAVTTDPNETFPILLQGFWSGVETALVNALPTGNYKLVLTNDAVTVGQAVGNAVVDEIHLVGPSGAPAAPAAISAAPGQGQASLSWSQIPGAMGYVILRSDSPDGPFAALASVANSVTGYSDATAVGGRAYYYRVAAIGSDGGTGTASPVAFAAPYLPASNYGFETPSQGTGTNAYSYNTANATWTFLPFTSPSGSGVSANGSSFTSSNNAAPQGTQVAFAQGLGYFSQNLTGLNPGSTYQLTYSAAVRQSSGSVLQSWVVKRDATTLSTVTTNGTLASNKPYVDRTVTFPATAASHQLVFGGTVNSANATVFIDNVRLAIQPPATPAALSSTFVSGFRVRLSWTDAAGDETAYRVERSPAGLAQWAVIGGSLPAGSANYTDTTSLPSTTYDYRVSALAPGGLSGFAALSVTTPDAIPTVPSGLAVTGTTFASATLAWNAATVGTSYNVKRGAAPGGPFTSVGTGLAGLTFTDGGLTPGSTYYYVVSSVSGPNESSNSSPVEAAIASIPGPGGLTVTPGFTVNALAWTAAPGVGTYTIRRATSAGGPFTVIATNVAATNYVDSGLVTGTNYFYSVSSLAEGSESTTASAGSGSPVAGIATKANNTVPLDVGASWSTGVVPTTQDAVLWSGTYANGTVSIGSGLQVTQVQVASPSVAVTISAGTGVLSPGGGGIDMSAATQNLTSNAPVTITASQIWNVAGGRTLTVNATVGDAGGNRTLTAAGNGTIVLGGMAHSIGNLAINGPAGGLPVYVFGGNNPAPNVKLSAGTSIGSVAANGRLDLLGAVSVGQLSGSGGQGMILSSGTSENVLTFVGGSSFSMFQTGQNGAVARLLQTGAGGVTFSAFGYNSTAPASSTTFDGGVWTLGKIGQNNTGTQVSGNVTLTGGANVTVSTATDYSHGTWNVINGSLIFSGAIAEKNGSATGNNTSLVLNVNNSGGGPGLLRAAGTITLADGGAAANANAITIGSGGTVQILPSGQLTIGSATARTAETDTVTLQSGGKLILNGTLGAAAATAGQTRFFEWTGGQLTATTITPGAGFSNPATGSGLTATSLVQNHGTLAPGDDGTAGKIAINGNYTLGANGTLALDIGGTTQGSGFQTGQYDLVAVSGATSLAGNLAVRIIGGFTPGNATTFTVLSSTGALSGAFANAAFGQRITIAGSGGSFLVSQSGNSVTLSQYLTALETWRLATLGTTSNSGNASDTYDFDGDGVANLLEYALGTLPAESASQALPVAGTSGNRLTLTFFRAVGNLTYIVEASPDLASWTTVAINPGSVGQSVTVTDTVDLPSMNAARRFIRLRVTSP